MANTDFRILLQTILDKSSVNSELKEVQKIINKHTMDIMPELKTASLRNQIKSVSKEIAADFNKTFGTNVNSQDIFKAYENQAKQIIEKNKLVQKSFTDLRKEAYQSIGQKSPELTKMASYYSQLEKESQKAAASIGKLATESQKVSAITKMQNYMVKNTAITNESKASIEKWIKTIQSADDLTKSSLDNINNKFKTLDASQRQLGNLGLSIGDSFKEQAGKFTQWVSVTSVLMGTVNTLRKMKDEVFSFDSSLVELDKVSDLTAEGLAEVTERAYELGDEVAKTGTKVIDAVTSFKRAGYDIADSFEYAEEALKTTNIAENLKDAGDAANSLVNIMKGFQNETPEFARKINDAINQVSNTEAVDFDNLIDGSTRLSAVADQAGMSFEQMLGTLTGAYEILGNMEKAASGQITIFSRLQAIQLEGEETVSTVAKLQDTFYNATKGAVNIVDKQTGQLRNVYDTLDDIAGAWGTLDKNTQEALAIEAAGIRQKSVFLALMQNWQGVEDAVESASNSLGSADKENEKYLSSLQGKVEKFESSFQNLSTTVIDSDFLKTAIDGGTTFISVLDKIIEFTGVLTPLLSGIGITAFVKNFDWFCDKNYLKLPRF